MLKNQTKFKSLPKRYQPKGLSILYEDRDILVADKMSGLLTVSNEKVKENTAYYLLNDYVRKGNQKSRKRILSYIVWIEILPVLSFLLKMKMPSVIFRKSGRDLKKCTMQ